MIKKRVFQKPLVLGLTGGIATGKSEVLKQFKGMKVTTVSSDEIVHASMRRGEPAYRKILHHFGGHLLNSKKEIDRKALAKIVFASVPARRHLEKIIHPYVIKALHRYRSRNKGLLVLDIPLLFEARLEKLVDRIIVVYAKPQEQIKRLMRNRGYTRAEARQRIRAQWSMAQKCLRADYVLDNNLTLSELEHQTHRLLKGWGRARILKPQPIPCA